MVEEPVKRLAVAAIKGAENILNEAEEKLNLSLKTRGLKRDINFHHFFPVTYGLNSWQVKNLSHLGKLLKDIKKLLPTQIPFEKNWLPYLGDALNAGIAAIFAQEILVFLSQLENKKDNEVEKIYSYFTKKALSHIKKREPSGFVVVIGKAPSLKKASQLVEMIKGKKLVAFLIGDEKRESLAYQAFLHPTSKIEFLTILNDSFVFLGNELFNITPFFGFLVKFSLAYGKFRPGQSREILNFIKENLFSFLLVLGKITDKKAANIAGAISFGVQSVGQTYIPQLLPIHSLP